jgi:hypothetical protein
MASLRAQDTATGARLARVLLNAVVLLRICPRCDVAWQNMLKQTIFTEIAVIYSLFCHWNLQLTIALTAQIGYDNNIGEMHERSCRKWVL